MNCERIPDTSAIIKLKNDETTSAWNSNIAVKHSLKQKIRFVLLMIVHSVSILSTDIFTHHNPKKNAPAALPIHRLWFIASICNCFITSTLSHFSFHFGKICGDPISDTNQIDQARTTYDEEEIGVFLFSFFFSILVIFYGIEKCVLVELCFFTLKTFLNLVQLLYMRCQSVMQH